jgi:hypothetical protein
MVVVEVAPAYQLTDDELNAFTVNTALVVGRQLTIPPLLIVALFTVRGSVNPAEHPFVPVTVTI